MSETVVKEFVEKREVVRIAGREVVLSPLSTYKFNEACRLVADIIDKFGVGELLENIGGLGENATAAQAGLTLAQKALLFCVVALARVSIAFLRNVLWEVD